MNFDLVAYVEIPMLAHGASILIGVVAFAYLYYIVKWVVSIFVGG